jgi:hypothetical protein
MGTAVGLGEKQRKWGTMGLWEKAEVDGERRGIEDECRWRLLVFPKGGRLA